jgi:hypothetical protein
LALRLFFRFTVVFPSFVSNCGLGGVLNAARNAPSARRVGSTLPNISVIRPLEEVMAYRPFERDEPTEIEAMIGEKIAAAIGYLLVTAAAVDHGLTLLIMRLVTNDDETSWNMAPLLMGQDVSVKLGVLRTFLVHRVTDREELKKSLHRIKKCFDKRNLFAHGGTSPGRTDAEVCVREFKLSGKDGKTQRARYFLLGADSRLRARTCLPVPPLGR